MITVESISKSYAHQKVLSDISFSVDRGKIFGIIGPDGSGKTTLFRILATLIKQDEGNAMLNQLNLIKDYKKIRKILGYMPGRFSLYPDLTVKQNLSFFATLFKTSIPENYDLIKDIYQQIEPFNSRKAGALSGGMKQKLALCCALIHKPCILLLDEPTTGVDPISRKDFWDTLLRLKEHGITILVSTPYMDEARLCDQLAMIRDGRFMMVDTPKGIVENFSDSLYQIKGPDLALFLRQLRNNPSVKSCYSFGDSLHMTLKENNPEILLSLKEQLEKNNMQVLLNDSLNVESPLDQNVLRIEPLEPSIEDCFMHISNNN